MQLNAQQSSKRNVPVLAVQICKCFCGGGPVNKDKNPSHRRELRGERAALAANLSSDVAAKIGLVPCATGGAQSLISDVRQTEMSITS